MKATLFAVLIPTLSRTYVDAFLAPHGGFSFNPNFVDHNVKCQQMSSKSSTRSSQLTSLSMGLTLYGSPGSRSPLIDWAAYELDVPFDRAADLSTNPHPFRQIPCLVDDSSDAVVFESGAILIHLLNMADSTSDLEDKQRAAITSWIVWANASLDPICFLETPDGKVYDTGLKKPNRRIDTVDQILSTQKYLLGDEFTIADVAVAAYLLYVPQFFPDVNLSRWPNVVRYMKDCVMRDMYGKAFGPQVQQFLSQKLDSMGNESEKKMFGLF